MHLVWDYHTPLVELSMPGYVTKALQSFDHAPPLKPQLAPHTVKPIVYGTKVQLTAEPDTAPSMAPDRVKRLQQIVETFLYYARAIDSTMLVTLATLAAAQTKATLNTEKAITHFLDYAATNPNATVVFFPSAMKLNLHSDVSYRT
jgi:hydroxypyruvate isomerase